MCRSTAGPLLAMIGVAGASAGIALAVVRERIDRLSDTRAAKQAASEQEAKRSAEDSTTADSSDATDD